MFQIKHNEYQSLLMVMIILTMYDCFDIKMEITKELSRDIVCIFDLIFVIYHYIVPYKVL